MEPAIFCTMYQCREQDLGQSALGSFVRNGAYANIAELVRDYEYAPSRIPEFAEDYGRKYQLWTSKAYYDYEQVCQAQAGDHLEVCISIKDTSRSCFFLEILIHQAGDSEKLFVRCVQRIACQLVTPKGLHTVSWQKIPTIKEFVLREQSLADRWDN